MSTKFSFYKIITDHISTIYIYSENGNHKRKDWLSIFIDLILPFIIAISFICFKIIILAKEFTVILTAFSVFAALLLNLMILIYSIMNKENDKEEKAKNKKKLDLLKETYENIQFTVLSSVIVIFLILALLFIPFNICIEFILSFIIYYFIFTFIFTLFMILKRTHAIMSNE